LWDKAPPQNILVNIFGKLTDPGDSHHFSKTLEVLALPIQAPWGSTKDAVELALSLKPKVIIPIHDWMWREDFRRGMYQRLISFFAENGIQFKGIEKGEIIEV
jgi:L-ascorbate metabolism protein UlaG (beta-lactamase superfamily)